MANEVIELGSFSYGLHLIDHLIGPRVEALSEGNDGLVHLFLRHTSAGLLISENYDPDVRLDMLAYFDKQAPMESVLYRHSAEGPDDMPAHIKSMLTGVSLTIPVSKGRLMLGTWQGIYLAEFRTHQPSRQVVLSFLD